MEGNVFVSPSSLMIPTGIPTLEMSSSPDGNSGSVPF
jgi:hypothetical protein